MYSENEDFNDEYEENTNNSNGSLGDKFREFYESNKKMVLILAGLLLLLIILLMMNSCSNNQSGTASGGTNNKIKIIITPTESYLNIGNSVKLVASVEPKGVYENTIYTWKSSDDTVASVDSFGNVEALKLGETIITVSFVDDKSKTHKEECKIYVVEGNKDIAVTGVSFPEGEVLITRGDKYQLAKQVTPTNGFVEKVVYTSSNSSIVEVDDSGNIKALSDGVATIKMTVNDRFNDEIIVNVVSDNVEPQIIINPLTLLLDNDEITITKGDTKKLTYQVLPPEAYVEDLLWTSSDESIAVVDQEGVVTAKNEGNAIITVKSRNGKTDNISIKVEKGIVKVNSVSILSNRNLTMNTNDTSQIVVDVLPSDATDKTVKYTSSNDLVAKVSSDGLIRALYEGNATITVTTNDGSFKESVNVTVLKSSSSGSSGSSGSSSGSSVCNNETVLRVKSDSGDAITSEEGGTSNVAKKSKVTIDIREINSSCGTVEELKYCYHKYDGIDCLPTTVFGVDDSIVVDVPAGEGIMQIVIKAEFTNGKDISKKYFMKYDRDEDDNENISDSNQSSEIKSLNFEYQGTENKGLGLGNVVFGKIKFSLNKKASSINYCLSSVGSTTCNTTGNTSSSYRSTTTYSGISGYRLLNANTLYRQGYLDGGNSSGTLYIGAWNKQYFCFSPKYADGTTDTRQCVEIKSN